MFIDHLASRSHEHVFLGAGQHANERHTHIVIGLTAAMMVVEIAAGWWFNSSAIYHVTSCGNRRELIFVDDGDCRGLLDVVGQALSRFDAQILA